MKIMNEEIGIKEVIMFIKSMLIVYFLFFPVLLLVVGSEFFLIFGLLGLISWVVSNRQIKRVKQFFYVKRKKLVREQPRGRPSVLYKISERDLNE